MEVTLEMYRKELLKGSTETLLLLSSDRKAHVRLRAGQGDGHSQQRVLPP